MISSILAEMGSALGWLVTINDPANDFLIELEDFVRGILPELEHETGLMLTTQRINLDGFDDFGYPDGCYGELSIKIGVLGIGKKMAVFQLGPTRYPDLSCLYMFTNNVKFLKALNSRVDKAYKGIFRKLEPSGNEWVPSYATL